jgi:hypothetical protein
VIVVVEGPSAAGKTTWIAAHCSPGVVVGEAVGEAGLDREADPVGAGAYWAAVNSGRWQAAQRVAQACGLAVCDTDPFKLHYVWSLWRIGHASYEHWQAEWRAAREEFADRRLGIADLILVEIPDQNVLAARRSGDRTRRRRHFDLHSQLARPLREWYQAVEQLDPLRVRWSLPADGVPETGLGTRSDATGAAVFDRLIGQLPAR